MRRVRGLVTQTRLPVGVLPSAGMSWMLGVGLFFLHQPQPSSLPSLRKTFSWASWQVPKNSSNFSHGTNTSLLVLLGCREVAGERWVRGSTGVALIPSAQDEWLPLGRNVPPRSPFQGPPTLSHCNLSPCSGHLGSREGRGSQQLSKKHTPCLPHWEKKPLSIFSSLPLTLICSPGSKTSSV